MNAAELTSALTLAGADVNTPVKVVDIDDVDRGHIQEVVLGFDDDGDPTVWLIVDGE